MKYFLCQYLRVKNTLYFLVLFSFLFSCNNTDIIDINTYKLINEFTVVRIRKKVFDNDKREVLSELTDTISLTLDKDYFLSILFEREWVEGRLKNTDIDKQNFFERNKKLWSDKVNLQKRLLDSLVAYRDTFFLKSSCNPKKWSKYIFSSEDTQYGWPYMLTDSRAEQQLHFLDDLTSKKLHDTITFEAYFANYWKNVKKNIVDNMSSKINPADIGPRVRCSGRVRTTSYSARRGSQTTYTSCSAYTNNKSGRCSFH